MPEFRVRSQGEMDKLPLGSLVEDETGKTQIKITPPSGSAWVWFLNLPRDGAAPYETSEFWGKLRITPPDPARVWGLLMDHPDVRSTSSGGVDLIVLVPPKIEAFLDPVIEAQDPEAFKARVLRAARTRTVAAGAPFPDVRADAGNLSHGPGFYMVSFPAVAPLVLKSKHASASA